MDNTTQVYSHIVVGIDLGDDAPIVLQKAATIAKQNNARLFIATVVEPIGFAYGGDIPLDIVQAQTVIEDQARRRLKEIIDHANIGICDQQVLIGGVAAQLHQHAETKGADLIIVGSHGRHGLALLLGSTANGVLHGAKTDVLAVMVKKQT